MFIKSLHMRHIHVILQSTYKYMLLYSEVPMYMTRIKQVLYWVRLTSLSEVRNINRYTKFPSIFSWRHHESCCFLFYFLEQSDGNPTFVTHSKFSEMSNELKSTLFMQYSFHYDLLLKFLKIRKGLRVEFL